MFKQSEVFKLFKTGFVFNPKVSGIFYNVFTFAALFSVVSGLALSLMSAGVLGIWVGSEVSFLGTVCFLSGMYVSESESTMKYFVVQVVGSNFLVLGLLMLVYYRFCFLANAFILIGLSVKLGMFPFHFWVPSVMSALSWPSCFVVVIQKVAPLWLLANLCLSNEEVSLMELVCSVTCFVGCLGGVGMMSYRALLGYSSLAHLGLMGIICLVGVWEFAWYFTLYGLINAGLMWSLWALGMYSYHDVLKEGGNAHYLSFWWFGAYLFSLAGVPPFSGFFLKVYFLVICWKFFPLGCMLCFASSIFSAYYYFSFFIDVAIFWGKSAMNKGMLKSGYNRFSLVVVSALVNLIFSYPLVLILGV